MTPSVGRIVHYMLTGYDADMINGGRATSNGARHGNQCEAGQVYPMLITRVWASDVGCVNGTLFLDGSDTERLTSRTQVDAESTDKQGHWFAPPRV